MGRGGQAKSGGEGEARDPLGRIRGAQSVGIVIVGDEVLLGKVFVCRRIERRVCM